MKNKRNFVLGLLLSASLISTIVYSNNQHSYAESTQPNTNIISKESENPDLMKTLGSYKINREELWIAIAAMIACGAIGGFVFELLTLQGNVEMPHFPTDDELAAKFDYAKPKHLCDLGFISRCIIGGFAAPATILFFRPESYFALLAMSVVAGSAGTALFRSLQDRLLLAIAQKDKLQAEKEVRKDNAKTKLDEALDIFETLEKELRKVSDRPQLGSSSNFKEGQIQSLLKFDKDETFDFHYFDNFKNILAELKGMNVQIDEAMDAYKTLLQEVRKISERKKEANTLTFLGDAELPLGSFDNIRRLLNEAKGINENIVTVRNIRELNSNQDLRKKVLK